MKLLVYSCCWLIFVGKSLLSHSSSTFVPLSKNDYDSFCSSIVLFSVGFLVQLYNAVPNAASTVKQKTAGTTNGDKLDDWDRVLESNSACDSGSIGSSTEIKIVSSAGFSFSISSRGIRFALE